MSKKLKIKCPHFRKVIKIFSYLSIFPLDKNEILHRKKNSFLQNFLYKIGRLKKINFTTKNRHFEFFPFLNKQNAN